MLNNLLSGFLCNRTPFFQSQRLPCTDIYDQPTKGTLLTRHRVDKTSKLPLWSQGEDDLLLLLLPEDLVRGSPPVAAINHWEYTSRGMYLRWTLYLRLKYQGLKKDSAPPSNAKAKMALNTKPTAPTSLLGLQRVIREEFKPNILTRCTDLQPFQGRFGFRESLNWAHLLETHPIRPQESFSRGSRQQGQR